MKNWLNYSVILFCSTNSCIDQLEPKRLHQPYRWVSICNSHLYMSICYCELLKRTSNQSYNSGYVLYGITRRRACWEMERKGWGKRWTSPLDRTCFILQNWAQDEGIWWRIERDMDDFCIFWHLVEQLLYWRDTARNMAWTVGMACYISNTCIHWYILSNITPKNQQLMVQQWQSAIWQKQEERGLGNGIEEVWPQMDFTIG